MSYRKIILILCLGIFLSAERNVSAQTTLAFNYVSNATQLWTVPACVTSVTVSLWGGGGGSGNYEGSQGSGYEAGGPGAYYTGVISGLTAGQVLTLYVPSGGGWGASGQFIYYSGNGGTAGWPGGGLGGWGGYNYSYGGGGGGYAAIAINGTYYVVAGAGGGGGGYGYYNCWGGYGGATSGDQGGYDYGPAGGGTLTFGGAAAPCIYSCGSTSGSFLQGGIGDDLSQGCGFEFGGGGGGGGYYGGGGGSDLIGGGGGGSSYPGSNITINGITFTRGSNLNGNDGANAANYPSPNAPPNIGFGGYWTNGGNGQINITYIALVANVNVINHDSCRNQSNGRAYVSVTGGTTPYTYSWSPIGGNGDTATGLPQGTYTVTVTSPCGGSVTAAVTINQPNILAATTSINAEVQCNGGNNGAITGIPLGGGAPYTYTWSDANTQTAAKATGLSAGTYTVTINDYCGGTATAKATITQPAVFSGMTAATTANVLCNGSSTGSANVTGITGGGTPYTYKWTPSGGSNAVASGLSAGTYTITVTDGCAATESAAVTITQPATALSISANTTSNVNCNGGNQGAASSLASGGTGAYTYSWAPSGGANANATNLTANTYTVTVKDNNGCTATAKTTITQPNVLSVSVSVTANVRCRGGNTGATSSSVSGGTNPYTYSWSGGGGTNTTATGLTAGTYSLTVTDNHGCSSLAIITVTQPNALAVSASVTSNAACNGGSGGAATATASNGTSAYTYAWSPSAQTTAAATGLSAGAYTVTLTDNCGATVSAAVTITQPLVVSSAAYTLTNVLCNGGKNGSVIDSAKGGTSPYTYAWTGGATTQKVASLSAGTYTVSVKDAHGCSATASTVITQAAVLVTNAFATANVLCNGDNNGSAGQTTIGGTSPYGYVWTPAAGTQATASGLTAGIYTLAVVDQHGCTASSSATITQPLVLSVVTSAPINETCFGDKKGQANAVVKGGTLPYTYSWNPSAQTTANATGLSAGTYTVNVWDVNNCTTTATITITQPIHLQVSAGTVLNNLCYNVNIGTVVTYIGAGVGPYTYTWSPNVSNGDTASGLGIGSYTVSVTDARGCTGTSSSAVSQPTQLNIQLDAVPDNGACSGSAWLTVSGGISPYSYLWTDGNTTFLINKQCTGNYCCTVTDANGCIDNICTDILSDAGVANISSGNVKISIYPNPTTGQFTLVTSGVSGESLVEVYDVLGAKVYSTNVNGTKMIDLGNEPNGIYLYRVMSKTDGNLLGQGKIVLTK